MADNFSQNHIQGIFGEFSAVFDETVAFSQDNTQGVFGEFSAVLDEAAGVVGGGEIPVLAYHHYHHNLVS